MEDTPEEFVDNLVKVFREVKRVLRDDGTVWLNLGDSYSSGGRTTTTNQSLRGDKDYGVTRPKPSKGIKPKDLIGIPWRVAFALQQDGWYLRQDIIWHKPNPMPESVKDRCTKAHEYIFLLSKSPKYYFDNEAIKEDSVTSTEQQIKKRNKNFRENAKGTKEKYLKQNFANDKYTNEVFKKRNKRSVWTVTTKPFKGAHFATFPMDLIEPCLLSGCPENGTVLDPFGGSGTTGIVASNHNRKAVLIELNAEYIEIARQRIQDQGGLFTDLQIISGDSKVLNGDSRV
jgi:site-specific DNA-methyltransferase (adenine-specific)